MDVVTAIMNDHRVLLGLLDELSAAGSSDRPGDRADRAVRLAEVGARLTAHGRAAERYLYPVLRKTLRLELPAAGADEHRAAEEKLAEARAADDTALVAEFVELLRAHVRAEEETVLPALKAAMSIRKRDDLGRRFEGGRLTELRRAGIDDSLTKEDLYIRAQQAGIPGRSSMSKEELARALLAVKTRN